MPEVDRIIMLENGSFAEIGTFSELKALNGIFTSFIKTFSENQNQDNESKKITVSFNFLVN